MRLNKIMLRSPVTSGAMNVPFCATDPGYWRQCRKDHQAACATTLETASPVTLLVAVTLEWQVSGEKSKSASGAFLPSVLRPHLVPVWRDGPI